MGHGDIDNVQTSLFIRFELIIDDVFDVMWCTQRRRMFKGTLSHFKVSLVISNVEGLWLISSMTAPTPQSLVILNLFLYLDSPMIHP
jgi:hypothetical protein